MAVVVGPLVRREIRSIRLVGNGCVFLTVMRQVLVDERVRHRPAGRGKRGQEKDRGHPAL